MLEFQKISSIKEFQKNLLVEWNRNFHTSEPCSFHAWNTKFMVSQTFWKSEQPRGVVRNFQDARTSVPDSNSFLTIVRGMQKLAISPAITAWDST